MKGKVRTLAVSPELALLRSVGLDGFLVSLDAMLEDGDLAAAEVAELREWAQRAAPTLLKPPEANELQQQAWRGRAARASRARSQRERLARAAEQAVGDEREAILAEMAELRTELAALLPSTTTPTKQSTRRWLSRSRA